MASKRVHTDAVTPPIEQNVITFARHVAKQCTECGAKSTPQWRQGPAGPQTLCNACGVRYSRLTRKAKAPKRHCTDTPFSSKDEQRYPRGDEDAEQDSEGTTTFHPSPANTSTHPGAPHPSPKSPAPPLPAAILAPSPVRTTRSVRTALPFLQPGSPPSAPTATPSSRPRPLPRGLLDAALKQDYNTAAGQLSPAGSSSEQEEECEAANLLLSIAHCAEPSRDPSASCASEPEPLKAAVQPAVTGSCLPLIQSLTTTQVGMESMLGGPQGLLPCLQGTELHALQQLCTIFDDRFKDLVAAQVACSAVEQVLRVKQEEARLAQLAARGAAQLLMTHAAQLINHEGVQRALAAHAAKLEAVQETDEGKAALAALACEPSMPTTTAGSQASNEH